MSYQKLLTARVALAALFPLIQELGSSRELSAGITSLQSGRMLLGSVAELMGSPAAYPKADDPKSAEIRPTADMPATPSPYILPADPVAAVKTVRALLEDNIQGLRQARTQLWPKRYGNIEEVLFDRALSDIILAKQWLGEQLAVIAGHPLVKSRAMSLGPLTAKLPEFEQIQSKPPENYAFSASPDDKPAERITMLDVASEVEQPESAPAPAAEVIALATQGDPDAGDAPQIGSPEDKPAA